MNWIDWIGYLAAGLVVVSFLAGSNIRLMRIINMSGAVAFVVYGFFLNTNLPVIIPNVFVALIQFYYLFIKKQESGG